MNLNQRVSNRVQTEPNIQPSNNIEQSKYQSRKKLKSLFYIKSKHTQRNFRNHTYFSTINEGSNKREQDKNKNKNLLTHHKKSLINQKRLMTQVYGGSKIQKPEKSEKSNQFVDCPTQYGLENIYQYMHDKSFLHQAQSSHRLSLLRQKQKRRYSFTYNKTNEQDSAQKVQSYMKMTTAYQFKFLDVRNKQDIGYATVTSKIKNQKNEFLSQIKTKTNLRFRISQKRKEKIGSRVKKNQTTQMSKSFNQQISQNRSIIQRLTPKNNLQLQRNGPASYPIRFMYGKRLKHYSQLPHREISFNILPYLINTFLKCKIHYKDMTQSQFLQIRENIVKVLVIKAQKIKYDIKDIINIGTIKGILNFLQQFEGKQKDYEWIQTIKYFFIVNEEKILEYQLNKIKDQVAKLISIKFDAQFGQRQVVIFDTKSKKKVESFYDLLKGQKYLIGDNQDVLLQYEKILNENSENKSLQKKIQKWKQIAESQSKTQSINRFKEQNPHDNAKQKGCSSTKSLQNTSKISFSINRKKLSQQKFNSLFEHFKSRQKKKNSKVLPHSLNIKLNSSKSFIDRQKLKKEEDIFQ